MNKNFISVALIAIVNALGYGIIIPILYAYSKRFGLSDFENGLLFSTFAICSFIATPVIGRLSDKYGRKPLLTISLLGTAVSFFLAAFAPNAVVLFIARALDGITAGNISVASAVIADTTDEKSRAKGFGIIGAAFGFGGGRVRRGRNVEVQIKMTFKESVRGFSRDIEVPDYRDGKQHGNKKIHVEIPAGVEHGQQLQMDGAGETVTDGRPGKLFITAIVEKHPTIRKEGQHLVMDLHVPLVDALLGKKIEIETLDGKETIEIPEGMPVGHIIKLKGKGVSAGFMRNGDFLIVTHIDMPKKISKDAKKIIEELRKGI